MGRARKKGAVKINAAYGKAPRTMLDDLADFVGELAARPFGARSPLGRAAAAATSTFTRHVAPQQLRYMNAVSAYPPELTDQASPKQKQDKWKTIAPGVAYCPAPKRKRIS